MDIFIAAVTLDRCLSSVMVGKTKLHLHIGTGIDIYINYKLRALFGMLSHSLFDVSLDDSISINV